MATFETKFNVSDHVFGLADGRIASVDPVLENVRIAEFASEDRKEV